MQESRPFLSCQDCWSPGWGAFLYGRRFVQLLEQKTASQRLQVTRPGGSSWRPLKQNGLPLFPPSLQPSPLHLPVSPSYTLPMALGSGMTQADLMGGQLLTASIPFATTVTRPQLLGGRCAGLRGPSAAQGSHYPEQVSNSVAAPGPRCRG